MAGGKGALLANRYRVVRQLGQGGMGSVWLAEDTQLDNKQFAIKMLPSILVSNKRAYRQLKDEALVAMQLVHPSIVQIRAFEENGGNPFLVMDYIDGQTLDDYLAEKGKLSEEEAIKLLKPIAVALDYAHTKGVVHRDVKPGNVMIANDGTPYILDFGIAREIQETMTRVTGKLSSGTLLYMSPEQLRGQPPTPAQDVYSFAAMAYECLKGEPPFSHGQIEYQIINESPAPLPDDAGLAASIMRGLSKAPGERPELCSKVLLAASIARRAPCVEPHAHMQSRRESPAIAAKAAAPQKRNGLGNTFSIVCLVVVCAVLGGVVWHREIQRRESTREQTVAMMQPEVTDSNSETDEEVDRGTQVGELPAPETSDPPPRKGKLAAIDDCKRQVDLVRKDIERKMKDVDAFRTMQGDFSDIISKIDNDWKRLEDLPEPMTTEEAQSQQGIAGSIAKTIDERIKLLDTRRTFYIKQSLKTAREAKDSSSLDMWDLCIKECEKVLEWDSANVEAERLKMEAERRLVPSARTIAKVGGREVREAKFTFDGKTHIDPKWDKLTAGASLFGGDVSVEYTEGGKRYVGTLSDCTVNWRGPTNIVVVLKEYREPKTSEVKPELRFTSSYPSRINEGFLDISDKFITNEEEQVSKDEYRNFVLRFEYKHVDNFFGGIEIRTPSYSETQNNNKGWPHYDGMCSIPIIDDEGSDFYDKANGCDRLKAFQYTGSIYGISPARRDNVEKQIWGRDKLFATGGSYARKHENWNFMEIKVVGSTIEVFLNGQQINKCDVSAYGENDVTPDGHKYAELSRKCGHIRFTRFAEGRLMLRNVRVLRLPDNVKAGDVIPANLRDCPLGFEQYFTGYESDLGMWKGVTTEEQFDNPITRQLANQAKRKKMQKIADDAMRQHWFVRNGSLFFDGFRGGYSIATIKDYADFEMWVDWRIMSFNADSGLYLRGSPQVQIWDAHNQWHIGSGGLFNNKQNPDNALKIADRPIGDWNRFHIVMKGDKVTVWLNGELVVDNVTMENYWDRRRAIFPCEQIELQCHGDPVEWRNIFIKRL